VDKKRVQKAVRSLQSALRDLEALLNEEEDSSGEKCLMENCRNVAKFRGLCPTHYTKARKEIRSGAVTEEQLMDSGLMLPEHKPGRPRQPTFEQMVSKKKAKKRSKK